TVKLVFAAVLPLLASWVGTILAFYFSKENFLAAAQTVNKMALDVSGLERLKTISAREKMRPLAAITYEQVQRLSDEKKRITELLMKFASFERMLILDQNNVFRYLIYRSMVDRYLASFTLGHALPAGIASSADLTLKHLVDSDPKLKDLFQNAVGFVPE